jgi:bacterioferritin
MNIDTEHIQNNENYGENYDYGNAQNNENYGENYNTEHTQGNGNYGENYDYGNTQNASDHTQNTPQNNTHVNPHNTLHNNIPQNNTPRNNTPRNNIPRNNTHVNTSGIITRDQPMDDDLMPYRLPEPYPVPVNLSPNRHQAMLLSLPYAGKNSELTALTQYFVHELTYVPEYSEIARQTMQIAVIEMFHMEMIGGCIKQLGGNVDLIAYGGNGPQYWSGKYINYGKNIKDRILLDIKGEQDCINQYKRVIAKTNSSAINALLQRIIGDEEHHIVLLKSMLEKLPY